MHFAVGTTVGIREFVDGPGFFFFFLPTRVGAGASYFFAFFSFCAWASSPPAPSPRDC